MNTLSYNKLGEYWVGASKLNPGNFFASNNNGLASVVQYLQPSYCYETKEELIEKMGSVAKDFTIGQVGDLINIIFEIIVKDGFSAIETKVLIVSKDKPLSAFKNTKTSTEQHYFIPMSEYEEYLKLFNKIKIDVLNYYYNLMLTNKRDQYKFSHYHKMIKLVTGNRPINLEM